MTEMLKQDLIKRAAGSHHCPICVQHSKHFSSTSGSDATARSDVVFGYRQFPVAISPNKTVVSRNVHGLLLHRSTRRRDAPDRRSKCGSEKLLAQKVTRAWTLRWLPHFGRPRFIRTDPEGCFISRHRLSWLSEQRILCTFQLGEALKRTSTLERTIQTLKDGATRLSQQMQESTPAGEIFALVNTAFLDVVSRHGHGPHELLFGHA